MKVKLIFFGVFLVIIAFSASILYSINKDTTPLINTKAILHDITDDEYYGLFEFNKYDKANIKKIDVDVIITKASDCKVRDIEVPELDAINDNSHIRLIEANSFTENNLDSSHAQATKSIIFDSTGLSLNKLKQLFSDTNITVTIETRHNKDIKRVYHIGQLLSSIE